VVTVVEVEAEYCAKPAPDINVKAAAAIVNVLNIMDTPMDL
jgi:hypothetical protein